MAYTKYSLTPANNTAAPPDGAPEGMLPSAVNDTMRDMMAQIRDVGDGVRDGTYTMTAPKITGGTITGVTLTGNTLTNPVITGATITTSTFNGTVGATTASTGSFTTVIASTTMGVGAATPSASGAGITFPATQSASTDVNTLDDYEEGTFTPVLGTSNGGTATMSLQEGKYVKVGKIVQFSLQITWTAKNTWDFNTRISGLPFTATTNTGGYIWPNSCQMDANALTTLFIYGIESNSTIGYIQVINATGAQLTESSFPSSGRVLVNGCYQTT